MNYKDSDASPSTFEEYERRCLASADLTAADARKILSAHEVAGRSRMSTIEAKRVAAERWPEEVEEARESRVTRWRWLVAHGLRVTYAELSQIERLAGVTPLPSPGNRGSYASAEDVARVYAVGTDCRERSHSVRVRIMTGEEADEQAARSVLGLLGERYGCTEPDCYEQRGGGRAWYFEVSVPRDPAPPAEG